MANEYYKNQLFDALSPLKPNKLSGNLNVPTTLSPNINGLNTTSKMSMSLGNKALGGVGKILNNPTVGGTMGLATSLGDLFSTTGTAPERQMQTADAAVNAVSAGLSLIPGFGQGAGAALNLVNNLGGRLIKTPSFMKNYSSNQNVMQNAASFGGVAAGATDAESTKNTYNNSGLVGKLFGKGRKSKNLFNKATDQQTRTQGILNESQNAIENSLSSSDLFDTRNQNNQLGDFFNKGKITFGRKGTKLQVGGILTPQNYKSVKSNSILDKVANAGKGLFDIANETLSSAEKGVNYASQYVAKEMAKRTHNMTDNDLPSTNYEDHATTVKRLNPTKDYNLAEELAINAAGDPLTFLSLSKVGSAYKTLNKVAQPKFFQNTTINMTRPKDVKKAKDIFNRVGQGEAYGGVMGLIMDGLDNGLINKNKNGGVLKTVLKLKLQSGGIVTDLRRGISAGDRDYWNGFVDYVDQQGYRGNKDLDSRDTNLSRNLWQQYAKTRGYSKDYDEFVPIVQNEIQIYRNNAMEDMKAGRSRLRGFTKEQLNAKDFDWDKNWMPGLSSVDGWAGSKTTTWKFPVKKTYVHKAADRVDNTVAKTTGGETFNDKIPTAPDMQKKSTFVAKNEPSKFKDGGSVVNVIVEGELHGRKHSLKELEEFKDAKITNKGVPVVVKGEGGTIDQTAEVEREELILHKGLTEKIEKLYKDGSEEAMIIAGKILSEELTKNIVDKTDVISKIEEDEKD